MTDARLGAEARITQQAGRVRNVLSQPPLSMASFLCAVHARDSVPAAFALVEQIPGADAPTYAVRAMRALDVSDPTKDLLAVTASEEQYAGNVRFVTTGGQKAADALHAHGPSVMAVQIPDGKSAKADADTVPLQVLVDTFEMLYRQGAIDVPGSLDAGGPAVEALYQSADLDNAAPGSDRDAQGDLDAGAPGTSSRGPKPTTVEQSGSAASLSTEVVRAPVTPDEASAAAVAAQTNVARIAAQTGEEARDLGDAADTATALALAVWFGESSRDGVGKTDKADEATEARISEKPARMG